MTTIDQRGMETDDRRKWKNHIDADLHACQSVETKPVSHWSNTNRRPPIAVPRIKVRNGCLSDNQLLLGDDAYRGYLSFKNEKSS